VITAFSGCGAVLLRFSVYAPSICRLNCLEFSEWGFLIFLGPSPITFWWLNQEVRCSLAQGERKNDMVGFQTSKSNRQKTHASAIEGVATAASLTVEPSTLTLKCSPDIPLPRRCTLLFSTLKNLKVCDCIKAVTTENNSALLVICF
jgi:hypothetical protein